MKQAYQIFLALLIIPVFTYSQNLSYENIYKINTQFAISSHYILNGKFKCAIDVLKQLSIDTNISHNPIHLSRINNQFAEIYRKLGDSALCEYYYLKNLGINSSSLIPQMAQANSRYHFIYKMNKQALDGLYLRFHYNDK